MYVCTYFTLYLNYIIIGNLPILILTHLALKKKKNFPFFSFLLLNINIYEPIITNYSVIYN